MPEPSLRAISELIGPQLARELWDIHLHPAPDVTAAGIGACLAGLRALPEVSVSVIGHSFEGRELVMCSVGQGPFDLLAWGFPHPDEPMGAAGLLGLLEHLGRRGSASALHGLARWHVVVCADPDQAAHNEDWVRTGSFDALLESVRPEHLAREVDYGFPLTHGPFEQPDDYDSPLACVINARCVEPGCGARCRAGRFPVAPYPESLAIAGQMRRLRPRLVCSMHDTVIGGCYSFVLRRPDPAMSALCEGAAGACGLVRHLGQKIDSGRPWSAGRIDLLREPTLAGTVARFLMRPGVDPALTYLGNHSAANCLESLVPEADFLVPEAPHFTHPDFGDTSPTGETRAVRCGWERTRAGRRWCVRGTLRMPDGAHQAVLYRMSRRALQEREGDQEVTLTRGMLGVEAIMRRRWVIAQTDEMWRSSGLFERAADHILVREQRSIRVGAANVNDRSMMIFRLADSSDAPATRAQRADFRWRWDLESARRPARLGRALSECGGSPGIAEGAQELTGLMSDHVRSALGPHVRRAGALSQLVRVVGAAQAAGVSSS